MPALCPHTSLTLKCVKIFNASVNKGIVLNGSELTVPRLHAISQKLVSAVDVSANNLQEVKNNYDYLTDKVQSGKVIYGVNTGYGGSADVRSNNVKEVQKALMQHLNAGFGTKIDPAVTRGVMAIRANSLSRAMSGVRPEVLKMLTAMINHDIIPEVPMRGSISASGDLMPTSYIASAMAGRSDLKVYKDGKTMLAPEALSQTGLEPISFESKEALAVINSASFATSMGASVLYETNKAALLTQVATALSHEAMFGRRESFHPVISASCLPHPGHVEVAHNVWDMLDGSKFSITEPDMKLTDEANALKQDRYALRTSAQWLAAVPETLMESNRRIETEMNCTGDNPIIDHRGDNILHCGNFQGTSITVSMDQARQAIQMCGKLLFAQLSEILNVKMSNGLPPNLSGSDTSLDFGYKGTDTAMASYVSDLDSLTPPLTNHVVSAEMHNQAINSLALISARRSKESLEILHMMLANIFNAHVQAIDLRFLQRQVEDKLETLFEKHGIKMKQVKSVAWPWYDFAFNPTKTTKSLIETLDHTNNSDALVTDVTQEMNRLCEETYSGVHVEEIANSLGKGSSKMYRFIRNEVGIKFYHADKTLDNELEKIHAAIKSDAVDKILMDIFSESANKLR